MFLAGLNEQQKKTFLALAMKLIGSDGRLDPAERNLIEQMRIEMGLLQETDLPQGSIEELAEPFDTRRSQSIVLMECIALAYADQELSGEEEKILRALALIFEISEENATEMENWVLDFKKLQKRAEEILEK
jgi:uncharacterized tellurite resistance protein B-like protein